MEKEIKIAAKLYKCRDSAKSFFREDYKEEIQPYILVLKNQMEKENIDEMNALLEVAKTDHFTESKLAPVMFMAAVVELIEPSV